ncbi:Major latex protein domain containing protein [Parasponia andersonii]|uniref:Major latex protein domain containing protein n=1 Tax=Parasponia andersonii TaxID=3476 RepID=A0A2P5BIP2_PARAD|nr:Major latex protein domain containing protein [Parasponia andersonii]
MFYETYVRKHYLLPKLSPNVLKDVRLISGAWDYVGSVIQYAFAPPGNLSSKIIDNVRIDAIDHENKSIACTVLDGSESRKYYKSGSFRIQAVETSEGGGALVKISVEYEKQNEDVPPPTMYTKFAENLFKSTDAYLIIKALLT